MPKKRSHGGEQEYIPAGNGLASGTYASDDGNNAWNSGGKDTGLTPSQHVRKPKETKDSSETKISVEQQNDNDIKYNPKKQYTDEEIKNIISQSLYYGKKNLNDVLNQLKGENVNPQIKGLVLDLLASGRYKLYAISGGNGYYKVGLRQIHFASSNEGDNYANAETLFHECGHALDYTYKDSNGIGGLWSMRYISKKYGKSMLEMKNEELGNFLANGGFNKIKADFDEITNAKTINALQKSYDILKNEKDALLKDIENDIKATNPEFNDLTKQQGDLFVKYYYNHISRDEYDYQVKPIRERIQQVLLDEAVKRPEMREKVRYINKEVENLKTQLETEKKKVNWSDVNQKYMDLSDMCQAIDNKYKFNGGHDKNYFVLNNVNQATECFAEIQSALGTNQKSLEILQKYIPKTIEIYKEILGELNNGK